MGIGGFFDGIVLHQLLQWHHMVSETTPPNSLDNLEVNTVADGFFHLSNWVLTLLGVGLLYRARRRLARPGSGRMLAGGIVAGWGLFNLVEGLIDHHLLNVHHVRPGPNELLFDLGFLAWGAAMLVLGAWVYRQGARAGEQLDESEPAEDVRSAA